jgi:hypothetical protein
MEYDLVRRAYRRFLKDSTQITEIWRNRNVAEESVKAAWPKWIALTSREVKREYWPNDPFMVHKSLFDDLH